MLILIPKKKQLPQPKQHSLPTLTNTSYVTKHTHSSKLYQNAQKPQQHQNPNKKNPKTQIPKKKKRKTLGEKKKKNLIIVIKKKKNMLYGALTELVLELE